MKYVDDESRDHVAAMRKALRLRQKPKRCPKHPNRVAKRFIINEPGRREKRRWLCVECAAVHVNFHGSALTGIE